MKDATYSTCNATSAPRRSPSPGAARVTGLDLSLKSLEEARQIAADAEQDVDYVHANVYDAVDALQGRQFDVVYTGKGALCYLPDLQQWAKVVHELLKPGGALYLVEFHPLLTALREVSLPGESDDLTLRADYLEGRGAIAHDSTVSYTGDEVPGRQRSYEWHHGLGEIVTSLVGEGLHVTTLRESEVLPWPRWPAMQQTPEGWWRLPDDAPRIPYCSRSRQPGRRDSPTISGSRDASRPRSSRCAPVRAGCVPRTDR
ncbi:class I SAM-dependent methyltransferase [Kribbella sp. NBC_01510]|uniref:class I SAM-dependent methyltransferase n=1 Tax=Kribbella sp. NBC_01510 TaxID=2903581 RepID=UPI00386A95D4